MIKCSAEVPQQEVRLNLTFTEISDGLWPLNKKRCRSRGLSGSDADIVKPMRITRSSRLAGRSQERYLIQLSVTSR
jgi:hypothetical protein